MKKLVFSLMLVFAVSTLHAQKSEFSYKVKNNSVTITGWKGKGTRCVIPDQIKGSPVEVIGKRAFRNKNIQHIVLPKSLKRIETQAFNEIYRETINTIEVPGSLYIVYFDNHLIASGFCGWWQAHDFKAGVYTKTPRGWWLLNGELPSSFATFYVDNNNSSNLGYRFDVLLVNDKPAKYFDGGIGGLEYVYVAKPGTYKLVLSQRGVQFGASVHHEVTFEAGKLYKIRFSIGNQQITSAGVVHNITVYEVSENLW